MSEIETVENRVEVLRKYLDGIILRMTDVEERRCAYLHLYGVAQACALLALKRGENPELAVMAGMLHDIYAYSCMDVNEHTHKGTTLAKKILDELKITDETETESICNAIYSHSDKDKIDQPFNELLKDADVLQHCLYNPTLTIKENEIERYERLRTEFCF